MTKHVVKLQKRRSVRSELVKIRWQRDIFSSNLAFNTTEGCSLEHWWCSPEHCVIQSNYRPRDDQHKKMRT